MDTYGRSDPQHRQQQLSALLRQLAPVPAATLCTALGISQPTLSRALRQLPGLVSAGRGSRTRYALRRPLAGRDEAVAVYVIDANGQAHDAGSLHPLAPAGSCLDIARLGWPVTDDMADGWHAGLPYPVADMKPQGFLGRLQARAHHMALRLPENPNDWDDDDTLTFLATCGDDQPGNLIIGEPALRRWLARQHEPQQPIRPEARATQYPVLADAVTRGEPAGSSAGGEFPKFTATLASRGDQVRRVIVKFSGRGDDAATRRWADLLVCEHLALTTLHDALNLPVAETSLLQHDGRTFLEVTRFDRHGSHGRSGLCSLQALDHALLGSQRQRWDHAAEKLEARGCLDISDLWQIRLLQAFGQLIENTDMHFGNLSLRPGIMLTLAPVYDMLPMRLAPLASGEVPVRDLPRHQPLPSERPAWRAACAAAMTFWARVGEDERISSAFRALAHARRKPLLTLAASLAD